MAAAGFGARLAAAVASRESQLVLGLDPDPRRLWPSAADAAGHAGEGSPAARAAAAVTEHCRALLAAAAPACVAVKLQLACFERLGAPGWRALAAVAQLARDAGLLVLADGKRGDIDVSAAAYGEAFFGGTATPFGHVPGLGADALTVSPYLGAEALDPLLGAARAASGGLFVLVRTSNRGAAELQELALASPGEDRAPDAPPAPGATDAPPAPGATDAPPAPGATDAPPAPGATDAPPAPGSHVPATVSERVAALVAALGGEPAPGQPSDVGAVVGATAPERLGRLRELMPHAPFLLPGVGAQGGRVETLGAAFAPGPAFGLISVSRAISDAHEQHGGEPAGAARREAERLRSLAWRVAAA